MKLNSFINAENQSNMNYRQRVRNRFQQEITQISTKYQLTQLVIVLDNDSAFLLSNIFTITELVAMKIIYIQKLQVKRKKLDKHAIYFINPTKTNIDILISDFPYPNSPTTNDPPQYKKIHILFTTFIQKNLLKSLAISKGVLKYLAKNSLKQFYFSARILAPNLVDMGIAYLGLAFSHQSEEELYKRQNICKKIIQFIANYSSINTIRIFYKKSPNKVCQNMALTLEKTIKNYLGILINNRSPYLKKQADDLTILMMDRSIDTVTPFIHYLTYESLLFDFFKINMVTKTNLQDKSAFSYEEIQNSIYEQFRYKHISQALSKLPQALEDEKGRLQNLKNMQNCSSIDIKQLTQRIGDIKSNIDKLTSIWNQFKNRKIEDIADLEQAIATGITANGENTSSVKLINSVCELVKEESVDRELKLRLAILCLSCVKLSKGDYDNLLNLFSSSEEQKILKNLIALGVSYDGSTVKSTKTVTKDQQKMASKKMQTTCMHLNRYTSIIQLVVPLFCKLLEDPNHSNSIDKDVFGELVCQVFNSNRQEKIKFKSSRFGMCMIGGMSWSEVSAIRSVDNMGGIVLMADSMMTVGNFLEEIGKINIIN